MMATHFGFESTNSLYQNRGLFRLREDPILGHNVHSPVAFPLDHPRHVTSSFFPADIRFPDSGWTSEFASFTSRISISRHHNAVSFRCHDVTFSLWPPSLWFSQNENGRRRWNFKMGATANQIGNTSLRRFLRSTLVSLLHDMFLNISETHSRRILHYPQSWLPQVMSRLSKIFCAQITACYKFILSAEKLDRAQE